MADADTLVRDEDIRHDDLPVERLVEDDIRFDDTEFNPQLEPQKATAWLNLLRESEKAFEPWNDHCDKIDKLYGNLERLANNARDKEFQIFWANCEVIKPAIYSTPPEPVVVTKFKDRRPVYQASAEMLERCVTVAFDNAYINELMLQVRDDVALIGRGVAWCRYESGGDGDGYYDDGERVCIDFKHRKDFLHSVSRCWAEVTWVAAASYLTREQARKRFKPYSGDEYQDADYRVDRDSKEVGGADNRERAKFWEIWDKQRKRCVWVAEGCENILDEDKSHLDLPGYFPCPKPAYGSLQRGSLVPVPDVMQYKDQLEELNLLTSRIHALTDALEAKGFYPAGGAELADAIQKAITTHTPGRVLVPISNWAAFGGSKEIIVWLPIDQIANVIQTCIATRKEIVQDIYQVIGLSDIMRGASDPRETLGAQTLKTEYGSSRIRDKQYELVRLARDLVCITGDIITDKFDKVTMIEMSQSQLPTDAMKRKQVADIQQQLQNQQLALQKAQGLPQFQQAQQQNPEQMQQLMGQAEQMMKEGQNAIGKIMNQPSIEQVFHFLKDNRLKSFVLDIETDSTIQIDEASEKQRRTEFVGVLSQLLPQLAQMIMADPMTANFCGEVLKFATAPFRAGRAMDGAIDDLVAQMEAKAGQQRPDDPMTVQAKTAKEIESMKLQAKAQSDAAELKLKQEELKQKDRHEQMRLQSHQAIEVMKLRGDQQQDQAKAQQTNLKMIADRQKHQADMLKANTDLQGAAAKLDMQRETQQIKHNDMMAKAVERRAAQQFRQTQQAAQRFPGGV